MSSVDLDPHGAGEGCASEPATARGEFVAEAPRSSTRDCTLRLWINEKAL